MFDILEEDEEAVSPLSSSPAPIITSSGKQNRKKLSLKGTVSRDFLLLVLFMNQFPPANLPPVSTTQGELMAKFAAGVVDTGGKFATGVVDTGAICHRRRCHRRQI
jgi:hypothetical protein